jgi:ankyrin repeat protein
MKISFDGFPTAPIRERVVFFAALIGLFLCLDSALAQGEIQMAPLAKAAMSGDVSTMRSLLAAKPDVNQVTPYGDTPLHLTLRRNSLERRQGHVAVVDLLVSRGADVNIRNRRGVTPLMEAADTGDTEAVAYLVRHSASINQSDDEGRTPLSLAAYRHYSDIVDFLLDNGADKEARDKSGRTPLMNAIAAVLLSPKGSAGRATEEKEKLSTVRSFLAHGAEANAVDKEGWSPLALAAQNDASEIVSALVDKGADVNVQVSRMGNETPLMIAIRRDDPATVKAILKAKPNLSLVDSQSRTALGYAKWYKSTEMIEMLQKAGATR